MSIEMVEGEGAVMRENGSLTEGEETQTTSFCLGSHRVEVHTMQQHEGHGSLSLDMQHGGYGPLSLDIVIRGPSGVGSGCTKIAITVPAAFSSPPLPKPHEQVTLQPCKINEVALIPPLLVPPPPAGPVSSGDAPVALPLYRTPRTSNVEENKSMNVKEEWLKKMRGSLMVVSILLASATYQSAASPPKFEQWGSSIVFVISNSVAFGLSLGSIILLMGETTFHSGFKLKTLRVFVVGALLALAIAFSLASTPNSSVMMNLTFLSILPVFLLFVSLLTWWHNRKGVEK